VIRGISRSHRGLATAEDPLDEGDLRGALTTLGLRHAGHHLADILAAARPRRITAPAAGFLSTYLGVPPGSLIEARSPITPPGVYDSLVLRTGRSLLIRSRIGFRDLRHIPAKPVVWSLFRVVSPTRGWLRGVRAASLGVVGFVLAFVAHVTAGGAAPSPVMLILLAGLTGLAAVLLTAVRLSPLRIGVTLAAMQAVLHEVFGWLGAPVDCASTAVGATGAMQMGGQGGQSTLTCTAGMANAGLGQESVFGATAMLGAHIAATALMAALLAYGEKVLWLLVRWVRPAPRLRDRLPQLEAVRAVSSTAPPMVRLRLASGGVGRRGPPPQALSAIA
jgi:hypothetical protein